MLVKVNIDWQSGSVGENLWYEVNGEYHVYPSGGGTIRPANTRETNAIEAEKNRLKQELSRLYSGG